MIGFDIEAFVRKCMTKRAESLLAADYQRFSDEMRRRIDGCVDRMMADGLLDEVRSLLPFRHLNTLRTVGYTELFAHLDGTVALDEAVAQIKLNTWHYARKQLTWLRREQLKNPSTKVINIPTQ